MDTTSQKIELIISKVTELAGLTPEDRKQLYDNLIIGYSGNVLKDAGDILSPELVKKVETKLDSEIFNELLTELSQNPKGKEVAEANLQSMLAEMILSIQDKLSPEQKAELIKIVEK